MNLPCFRGVTAVPCPEVKSLLECVRSSGSRYPLSRQKVRMAMFTVSHRAKRLVFSSILCLCFWFLPTGFSATAWAEHEGKIQVLLLGDSTTEGSVPRRLKPAGPHLEQMLESLLAAEGNLPAVRVINSGLSGEYIERLFSSGRYDRDVAKLPGLDYIFIRYGLNDRARRENFEVNFPLDFHQLLARLREDHPRARLIPMTVIPYADEAASQQMNDLIRQVGSAEKLEVFDIYPAYAAALEQGPNMLNYRRFPLASIPEKYHPLVKPYVNGPSVEVMDNELDAVLGHLPGWYRDRHPNLAGYNVIAVETAKFLTEKLRPN